MRDPRIEKLARMIVGYSVEVKPGDRVLIRGVTAGAPLIKAVYAEVLRSGGHPFVTAQVPGIDEVLFKTASDDQLAYIHEPLKMIYENYEVQIVIDCSENTKALTNIDPSRILMYQKGRRPLLKTMLDRMAEGSLRWALTQYPTPAHAQDAEMSLTEFEDFYYNACMPDMDDPVGYWRCVSLHQAELVEWLAGKETIHVSGPETEITLSVKGRKFINCDCKENIPDGEIFTSPVEDSVNGHVRFSYPAIMDSIEVSGIQLWFQNGKVVKASAEKNEAFLLAKLSADEGASRVGEFAIGTNDGIQKFTKEILFDEKIGGSFHMAMGMSLPETGGVNESAIHWDMICDLRPGSEITADGILFYKDGKFILP